MNLQFVLYFTTLAETGNFTKAAERTNVVQSTFSAGIKKLEEQLDCTLFLRDKRNVQLSEEGKRLLPKAQQLLSLWWEIESDFKEEKRELRVGLLQHLLVEAVLPWFNRFRQNSSITVKAEEGNSQKLFEKLDHHELDCIFIKAEGLLDEKTYASRFVYQEKLHLAVAADHPLAQKNKISISAINGLPFIQRSACTLFVDVYKVLDEKGVKIEPIFASESDETVKGLVASRVGCSLISPPSSPEPNIRYLPFTDASFTSDIILVWRKDSSFQGLKEFLRG